MLVANNIKQLSKDEEPQFQAKDIDKIRKFAKRKNSFEQLANSLAPTIHGHEYIKKAVLCMLLGGREKVIDNYLNWLGFLKFNWQVMIFKDRK